mgnify:CR=1 FL=1
MKNYLSLFLLLCFTFTFSQNNKKSIEECATDRIMKDLYAEHPEMKAQEDAFNQTLSKMIKTGEMNKFYSKTTKIYEIPVVVHVVSDGSPLGTSCNRTDTEIINWINHVNDIYADNYIPGTSAVIPVKLVLAKIDPNCNPTNGIDRFTVTSPNYVTYGVDTQPGQAGMYQLDLTALGKWDPTKYYNIYVVKDTAGGGAPNGGWASMASGAGSDKDHAIIEYRAVTVATRHHVLSHEFGHAMGLYHTQEGSSGTTCPVNNNCSLDGDMVCDTEPNTLSSAATTPCQDGLINPCTGVTYAGAEVNVMTYTACNRSRFTAGQRDRAIANLLQYRQNLLNSPVLSTTPVNNNAVSLTPACTPATITGPSNFNYGITSVKFGDINNYSQAYQQTPNNFYENFTGNYCLGRTTTTIPLTVPTTITIAPGPATSNNPQHIIRAYIDYNNDGVFDETTERVVNQTTPSTSVVTVSITPPSTAVLNTPLRLRVIGESNTFASTVNACYNPTRGQVEDYSVTIQGSTLSAEKYTKNKSIIITKINSSVYVRSNSKISSVTVYDASGRRILANKKINSTEFTSSSLKAENAIIIVNVTLENGETTVKKIKF